MLAPFIITHRGLQPSSKGFYSESSIESFRLHINRKYSIEADINFTKDGIILCHDANLLRITNNADCRPIDDITTQEATNLKLKKGRLGTLDELIHFFIESSPIENQMLALHFKGKLQSYTNCKKVISLLKSYTEYLPKILIFDLIPKYALLFKEDLPTLQLAASISDVSDIQRYSQAVCGTLLSLETFLEWDQLYSWAWLDEWDQIAIDESGNIAHYKKQLYTEHLFSTLRVYGKKIAVVSPELHATSPGLLGGESHPDAKNKKRLFTRIREILKLSPDAICSDYPEEIYKIMTNEKVFTYA